MREVQDHSPARPRDGDLHQPATQAEAGLVHGPNFRRRHPREKRLEIALTYIYGIGQTRAQQTCAETGISPDTRVRDLTDEEVARLRACVDANFKVEGDLRRDVAQDIKRKMEIGCYQGIRHRKGLPVHGQRTHTNARTRKGPKKTVAGKKKVRK